MSITFTNELDVELIQVSGYDSVIASAARVSTGLDAQEHSESDDAGLISYLMKHRHGSPFEHNSMTFRVSAPIFVFREFQRHRIASYNEVSARYKKMEPKFYIYPSERPLVQQGSSAHPRLVPAHPSLTGYTNKHTEQAYRASWRAYKKMLKKGVANEVARSVLPVGLYSDMYVTMNLRAMFNFLSLRTSNEDSTFPSRPQWEIEQIARKLEEHVSELFPAAYAAWNANGRVSP